MGNLVVALAVAFTLAQTGTAPYRGVWVAEFAGKTYIRLELGVTNGTLAGKMGLGAFEVDARGDVRAAVPVDGDIRPLLNVVAKGSILSFGRQDETEIDQFELRVLGPDAAELRFLLTDEDKNELAESGVPPPKPIRLKKL